MVELEADDRFLVSAARQPGSTAVRKAGSLGQSSQAGPCLWEEGANTNKLSLMCIYTLWTVACAGTHE